MKYDIILIQPPLIQNKQDNSESIQIEYDYWRKMEHYAGKLLGDLPLEASHGILSIASFLKQYGYKIKILDFHLMDYQKRIHTGLTLTIEDVILEIKKYESKFFGLSVMTISENWAVLISNQIKKTNNNSFLFWGGYFPTKNCAELLNKHKNIDFIVRNEVSVK